MRWFESYGIATNPNDMRAMSGEEIAKLQGAYAAAHYNALNDAFRASLQSNAAYTSLLSSLTVFEEDNLDERFAAFKVRLAAAVARSESRRARQG